MTPNPIDISIPRALLVLAAGFAGFFGGFLLMAVLGWMGRKLKAQSSKLKAG